MRIKTNWIIIPARLVTTKTNKAGVVTYESQIAIITHDQFTFTLKNGDLQVTFLDSTHKRIVVSKNGVSTKNCNYKSFYKWFIVYNSTARLLQ